MKPIGMIGLAALFTVASAGLASAQEAFTTGDINMRAGPSTRFPVVETIPEGRPVEIHGCLSNFDWCDVSWRRTRGWVFSEYLEYVYGQRPVEFYEYRRRVGVPVISFGFGYWDRYYRNRPWFDEWGYWGDDRRRDRVRDDRRDDDRNAADRNRRDDDNRNQARSRVDDNRNQARNRDRNDYDDEFDRTGSTTRAGEECLDQQDDGQCDDNRRSQRRLRGETDEQGNRRRGNNDGSGDGDGGMND